MFRRRGSLYAQNGLEDGCKERAAVAAAAAKDDENVIVR